MPRSAHAYCRRHICQLAFARKNKKIKKSPASQLHPLRAYILHRVPAKTPVKTREGRRKKGATTGRSEQTPTSDVSSTPTNVEQKKAPRIRDTKSFSELLPGAESLAISKAPEPLLKRERIRMLLRFFTWSAGAWRSSRNFALAPALERDESPGRAGS